jgi:hypothetical protein
MISYLIELISNEVSDILYSSHLNDLSWLTQLTLSFLHLKIDQACSEDSWLDFPRDEFARSSYQGLPVALSICSCTSGSSFFVT